MGTVKLIARRDDEDLWLRECSREKRKFKGRPMGILLVLPVSLLAFRFLAKAEEEKAAVLFQEKSIFRKNKVRDSILLA